MQSEKMKAFSYALAVQQLRQLPAPDEAAIEAYREAVGGSREVVARHIMQKLGLEELLRPLMERYGASTPEQVLAGFKNKMITLIDWAYDYFYRRSTSKLDVFDQGELLDFPKKPQTIALRDGGHEH